MLHSMKIRVGILLLVLLLGQGGCSKQDSQAVIWVPVLLGVAVTKPFVSPFVNNASLSEAFPGDPATRELARAAGKGNLKDMDRLVAEGADVNATGKGGVTALGWALYRKNIAGFRHLLELGADPNAVWESKELAKGLWVGCSAMHVAKGPFLEAALEAGGDPNLECHGIRVVHGGCWGVTEQEWAMLEAHGVDYGFREPDGTPFILAVANSGSYRVVYHLLKKGVDPAPVDAEGRGLRDRMQGIIDYIGPRKSGWLVDSQKVWFWRCVELMEQQGTHFDMDEAAEMMRKLDLEYRGRLEAKAG